MKYKRSAKLYVYRTSNIKILKNETSAWIPMGQTLIKRLSLKSKQIFRKYMSTLNTETNALHVQ